jgi:hypothetical protein
MKPVRRGGSLSLTLHGGSDAVVLFGRPLQGYDHSLTGWVATVVTRTLNYVSRDRSCVRF